MFGGNLFHRGYDLLVEEDRIDLQTAADRLGVHYQTAYKWVRSGRLAADLVKGRYVLDPSVVAAFDDERSKPAAPTTRRPRNGFGDLRDRMLAALTGGDELAARAMTAGLIDNGSSLTTVIEELFVPALRQIGLDWHEGRLPIFVEHRASAILQQILGEHHPTPRGRRRGTAMVAALAGDRHFLATSMAAVALREDNWRVHLLGADMPAAELVSFCSTHAVGLAVLTVTNTDVADAATRTAAVLEAAGIRTLVGRPGSTLIGLQELARSR